jgi:antitoxin ParD1/3/4
MNPTDISLTPDNREFLEAKLAAGEFTSASDIVNEALRQARVREAKEKLAALLLEGINSGPGIEANEDYWTKKKAAVLERQLIALGTYRGV